MALTVRNKLRTGHDALATPLASPGTAFHGIDPASPYAQMVNDLIKDGELVDEAFDIVADRFNLGPYAPAPERGPGPVSYSSTRQAAQEAMAFEREQTAASQRFQAEQDALNRQAQERLRAMQELNALIQQEMANRQSAREMRFNLRGDDFALAGAFSGQGLRGTTPTQAFSGELENYANAPLPQVPQNATLPQINQGIQQVQGMGAIPTGGGFGMAEGGSMGPQGPDFSPPGYSVIVGEGALNGDEEVVTRLNDGTVLVTPLKGGAATGATLPTTPTATSSYPAISGLYESFGLQNFPRFARTREQIGYNVRNAGLGTLANMGYQPSLVSSGGRIYWKDPAGGLRPFEGRMFSRAGFNQRDILNVSPEQLATLGPIGPAYRTQPEISQRPAFGPAGVPLLTPFGQVLPNPFFIGAELRDAALNDPIAWSNYTSAYANARGPGGEALGISPEQLLAMAQQPLPTGVPRQVLGYR